MTLLYIKSETVCGRFMQVGEWIYFQTAWNFHSKCLPNFEATTGLKFSSLGNTLFYIFNLFLNYT